MFDAKFENRGEMLLIHQHLGADLDLKYARETVRSIFSKWTIPVHIETELEVRKRFFTYTRNHEFVAKD